MQGLARKVTDDDEEAPEAIRQPQVRPDELRILEALLFASREPLDEKALAERLPEGVDLSRTLQMLRDEYAPRGVNLVKVNGKWIFRTANDLAWLLTREAVQPRKLSRAAIETLAVIAYHQPVTRAEMEDIRGVSMSKGTIDVLLETGWIRPRGRRKVPGRPITYGTTEAFISHFGLEQLSDLPGLEELKGSGMLEGHMPPNFSVPVPNDDPTLRDDEDPLEPGDLDLGLAPRVEDEDTGAGSADDAPGSAELAVADDDAADAGEAGGDVEFGDDADLVLEADVEMGDDTSPDAVDEDIDAGEEMPAADLRDDDRSEE